MAQQRPFSTSRTFSTPQTVAPKTVLFRDETVSANTEYAEHTHNWSQMICIKSGVMWMNLANQRYLAPSEFAIWIPAGIRHSCHNNKSTRFRALDISPQLSLELPAEPCILTPTPIFNAIADDCFARHMQEPQTEAELRLCHVLLDQIALSPCQSNYLPGSEDKLLAPLLAALEKDPANNTSLAQWASQIYTTERTLARRFQQQLGMGFSEWRQRLRFLYAISLLEQGKTVQQVALEVGYSSSSAFIAMFVQLSGTTPQRYLQQR